MRLPFTSAAKRVAERARGGLQRAETIAAGSDLPAGQAPTEPVEETRPGARERARLRRRARRMRRMREAMLRELGLLVLELERRARSNPELVTARARRVREIDDELVAIARTLGAEAAIERAVLPGIAGPCAGCGTLLASDDRFCPSCGRKRSDDAAAERPAAQLELSGTTADAR